LKPRPDVPVTADDANFDAERLDRLLQSAPAEALDSSLEALSALVDAILSQGCDELAASPAKLRTVLLMFGHQGLQDPSNFEVLKKLLQLSSQLHAVPSARDTLVRWYSTVPLEVLEQHLVQVNQFVTLTLIEAQFASECSNTTSVEVGMEIAKYDYCARHVRGALRLMDMLWRANEQRKARSEDWRNRRKAQRLRQQGQKLEDESLSFLTFPQFHNDAINECEGILKHDLREILEMQHTGRPFPNPEEKLRKDFGILEFTFVLTAVSKVRMLSIELLLMQREEVRTAMVMQVMVRGGRTSPFLVLKVRRNAMVEDTLQQLAVYGPLAYKKPLKVVFNGEEGVDEGGVQKEFFQLLVEELFKEDFGMFERIEESRNLWFNKNSFEVNRQFELFGTLLGLAIYNEVILDVKFPPALYKKLMLGDNAQLGLSDLMQFQPSLAQGMIALLEHEDEASFEEVFGPLSFTVDYECFGSHVQADLIEDGANVTVTYGNREDYVQRYCDWLFNKSIERQFGAFRSGFNHCIRDTLFRQLFRHEELELVICGSMELDFQALEETTKYQDGFTGTSGPVRWFWEVVHVLDEQEKRSLLQFCTGCDRAPVGGLGRLPFIISRAGPDSDMLPWVHTCFNHLLLPDYGSKEKLEQRLRLAIQHSTGFGLM